MTERKDFDAEYEFTSGRPISENAVGAECEGVFAARHKRTGEIFAVKVFKRGSEDTNRKARSQAELMKFIDHPNIICTRDWFDSDRGIFLVMDLCLGGDLFDYISCRPAVSEKDVRMIAKQILQGLQHCHYRGIVHHDLKPENILMARPYPDLTVKITDFGFAQLMRTHHDMIQRWGGTESYFSPEVFKRSPHNEKSDMWSFGVILFVLLSGKPPFYCPTPQCRESRRCTCNGLRDRVCRGEFQFYTRYFEGVSESAKDLIRNLLKVNPVERLSSSESLQHRWFTETGLDAPLPDWLENMRQFNISRRDSQYHTAFALDSVLKHKPELLAASGITENQQAEVLAEGGVQPLITLVVSATTPEAQRSALNHLANYALTSSGRRQLADAGCVHQLVRLRTRTEIDDVSFFICLTLRRMIEEPEIRLSVSCDQLVLEMLLTCCKMRSTRASRAGAHAVAVLCREPSRRREICAMFGAGCIVNLLRSYHWEHRHDAVAALVSLAEDVESHPSLLAPDIGLIAEISNVVTAATEGSQHTSVAYVPTLHGVALLYRGLATASHEGCKGLAAGAVGTLTRLLAVTVDAVSGMAALAVQQISHHVDTRTMLLQSAEGTALLSEFETKL